MNRETIEKAAKEAVQNHFQCNGKYPCEERDYCEFCNGHNSAFDCKEDCGADDFNEGFIIGAQWRINSVWHDATKYKPRIGSKIAVLFSDEDFAICIFESEMKNAFPYLRIKCWAYLDDLLPDRKED